ncbi:hypothetical protein AB6735_24465 [Mucilaginibacter sp. RCC_168]|uniref:hypothetical protein n=1 Tax=Mucilaginibacter sp. RCC_168 TaxID=3239221 RepID=UPI003526274F
MKQELNELQSRLLSIKHNCITDVKNENDRFSFQYGGGQFFFIKSVSSNLEVGYLTLFHETPLERGNRLIEINDFIIKITKYSFGLEIRIKDHMGPSSSFYKLYIDDDEYLKVGIEILIQVLPLQLVAKLKKDDFRIYLK